MNRKLATVAIALLSGLFSFAQTATYEVIGEGNAKILNGIINDKLISEDATFSWWKPSYEQAAIDFEQVSNFSKNAEQINLVIFLGTWCGDSKAIIPKYYAFFEKAGFPASKITLIATDRQKKTLGGLTVPFNITRVPTVLVLKNGKEIGRIVEYGTTGNYLKELTEIVSNNP